MRIIEAILFEPVGCLAEFPADEFNEAAVRLFGRRKSATRSGSRSYWHLLNLSEAGNNKLDAAALELQAVGGSTLYEDVVPALSELKALGMTQIIASSLSTDAVNRFLEKFSLSEFFSDVWTRDNAGD